MLINLFFLLISTTLAFSYSEFRHSRFQIAVNKVAIRFLGQRFYKCYAYLLILGHSLLVIWFYKQSISSLIDHLNTYYKLNRTDPARILIEASKKYVNYIFVFRFCLFYVFLIKKSVYVSN